MVNTGWNECKLPDEWKDCKFRYARISNTDKNAGCGEMEFYTTDMSVTIGVPDNWSDRGVKAMDVESEKGVRIVNAPEKDNDGKVRNPAIWVDGKQGDRVEYPNNTDI